MKRSLPPLAKDHGSKLSTYFVIGMFGTVLLTLVPLLRVGFTTCDDVQFFLTARTSLQNWWNDAVIYAHGAGRFYFLITKWVYNVPYMIDSYAYTKAVQYGMLLVCYAMTSYLMGYYTHSRWMSMLTLLMLLMGTTITANNHVPTIAYPFYFTFATTLFEVALLLIAHYRQRGGMWRSWVAAALMLFSFCFYETFLIFGIGVGLMLFIVLLRENGWHAMWRSRKTYTTLMPLLTAGVVYMACYFGYRLYLSQVLPDNQIYNGAIFNPATVSIGNALTIIWRCTRLALPTYTFFSQQHCFYDLSSLVGGYHNNPLHILTHCSPTVYINMVLQILLAVYILCRIDLRSMAWRSMARGGMVLIATALSAHLLIAIADKYNHEWISWMDGYVTSFFSMLALMALMALIIAATLKVATHRRSRWTLIALWGVLIGFWSLLTGFANDQSSLAWQKSQDRLRMIDLAAKKGYFDTLPNDAILYVDEYYHTAGIPYDLPDYEPSHSHYIALRAGRPLLNSPRWDEVLNWHNEQPQAPVYYMHVATSSHNRDMMMALSKLDSISATPNGSQASKADILYLSATKRYSIYYTCNGTTKQTTCSHSRNEKITIDHIECDGINPVSIAISNTVTEEGKQ